MDCQAAKHRLSPYVDVQLPDAERQELETHLQGCPLCRSELSSLTQMLRVLRTVKAPASPDLVPGVRERLARRPWRRRLPVALPRLSLQPVHGLALVATAVLVVVVVGLPRFSSTKLPSFSRLERAASTQIGDQMESFRKGKEEAERRDLSMQDAPIAIAMASHTAALGAEADRQGAFQQLSVPPPSASVAKYDNATGTAHFGMATGMASTGGASGTLHTLVNAAPSDLKDARMRQPEPLELARGNRDGLVKDSNLVAVNQKTPSDSVSLASITGKPSESNDALGVATAIPRSAGQEKAGAYGADTYAEFKSSSMPQAAEQSQLDGNKRRVLAQDANFQPFSRTEAGILPATTHAELPAEQERKKMSVLAGESLLKELPSDAPMKSNEQREPLPEHALFFDTDEKTTTIMVRWHVTDVPDAVLRVIGWVQAHGGAVHGVDGHHLRIEIPSPHVAAFLQAFSDPADMQQAEVVLHATNNPLASTSPDRVTISLELIVPQ